MTARSLSVFTFLITSGLF